MSIAQCLARVQKTLQVPLVDARITGRHVAQPARFEPSFQFIDQAEQVIEGLDHEQQRLEMVDLKSLIDGPFELNP